METGIVGLETVQIDRIACWCSVDGPLLNEHPLEATPCITRIPTRQLTGKDTPVAFRSHLIWYGLDLEHRILAQLLLNSFLLLRRSADKNRNARRNLQFLYQIR
jgi:hypothetical protein